MAKKLFFGMIAGGLMTGLLLAVPAPLKRSPGFCVSCHLDGGTPLHAEKHRRFLRENPVDLAGSHRRKVPGEFSCAGCHEARSWGKKPALAWIEAKNTYRYFTGEFEEPKRLGPGSMPDENCEGCHKALKKEKGKFHGFAAHRPKVKVACIVCHSAHAPGRNDLYFLDDGRLFGACKKCHANIPGGFQFPSPHVD